MEMLLPGARMRMPGFHRLKLGGSLVGSGAWILYSIFHELMTFATTLSTNLILGPLAALLAMATNNGSATRAPRPSSVCA